MQCYQLYKMKIEMQDKWRDYNGNLFYIFYTQYTLNSRHALSPSFVSCFYMYFPLFFTVFFFWILFFKQILNIWMFYLNFGLCMAILSYHRQSLYINVLLIEISARLAVNHDVMLVLIHLCFGNNLQLDNGKKENKEKNKLMKIRRKNKFGHLKS